MNDKLLKIVPLAKVDEATHTTWGIVTKQTADKDGETCDYTTAKKAYKTWSDDFVKRTASTGQDISMGNIRMMHGLEIAGKAIKLEFHDDTKEVWLGTEPADDRVWKLIKGGFITGLSQGGKYVKRWDGPNGEKMYTPSISEVSYVDNPCLGEASFAYVKADGSMELIKRQNVPPADPELASLLEKVKKGEGELPTATQQPADASKDAPICQCKCAECMKGNCAGCTAQEKCVGGPPPTKVAKGTKYLVTSGGETHLPYTDESGTPNHRLMGAAWAALHGGYRGNKYEGPDKQGAIRRLKQIYAREGMETPSEKMERLDGLVKSMAEHRIQCRAYGKLGKGMYSVSRLAEVLEQIKYLWMQMEYEQEQEGDESPATDMMEDIFADLLDALLSYTEEQVAEEREMHGIGSSI